MQLNRLIYTGLIFLSLLIACREEIKITNYNTDIDGGNPPEGYNDLVLSTSLYYKIADLGMKIDYTGRLFQPYSSTTNGWPGRIRNSGLWIGAYQNGEARCNLVKGEASNFTTIWGDTIMMGVFGVTESAIANPNINWPYEYGAPVDVWGAPLMYGSSMAWSSFTSDQQDWSPSFGSPLQDLRVNQSVFMYERDDLRKAIFLRYDVKNFGEELTNIYSGYWSNVDISIIDFENDLIGYDEISDISYTYKNIPDSVTGLYYVFGTTFLKTPVRFGNEIGVSSHRILFKGNDQQFGEENLSSEKVINAMKGLDNNGSPMIDPSTGGVTQYAFTGRPQDQSGWLDQPRDTRSLISIGPYSIGNEESVSFVILMVVESSDSLSDALFRLKYRIGQIRQETTLWDQ